MTPEQQKALALMQMRRRRSEAEQGSVNTPINQQPANYWEAQDFAGQSYFDDEFKAIKQEEFQLLDNWNDSDSAQKYQALKQREKQLDEDKGKWNKGFPEELKALPELSVSRAISGESPSGKGTSGKQYGGVLAMSLLAPEYKDKVAILENSGWKVDMINGFPKITNPETGQEFSLNKPDFSERDFSDFMTQALHFSGVGPAVRTVTGIGKKMAVGAGVSALTEGTRQGLEKALGGEFDGAPVALAGFLGGASELALPVLSGIWRRLNRDGRESLLKATNIEDIQKLGVASEKELAKIEKILANEGSTIAEVPPLNRPQTTGSAQDAGALYAAAKNPEVAEAIAKKNSRRDTWAKGRIDKATSGATLEDSLKAARDASEGIFDNLYASRKAQADKLYGDAFENAGSVNLSGLRQRIKSIVEDQSIKGGEKDRILRLVGKYLDTAKKEPTTTLVRRLSGARGASENDTISAKLAQELKFEIDNLIDKRGMSSVGQNTEGALLSVQSELKNLIEEAAPGYKASNMAFKSATENIDVMQQDLIGLISAKNDSNLETIRRLMDSKDVPRLLRVKGLLDESGDQGIWAGLWKDWLKGKADKLPSNLMDKSNPADVMFNTIFGKEGSMSRIMELAPDKNSRQNMMWLRDYLQKSMRARKFSPESTAQAAAEKQIEGGFRAGLSKLIHSSRKTIAEGAMGTGEKKRSMAIFEAMEGPQWADRMNEVRKAKGIENQTELMSKLIDDILKASAQASRAQQQDNQSTQ